jgi:MFS family permease
MDCALRCRRRDGRHTAGTNPGARSGHGALLADLRISRVRYAELNFWATIVGSAGAIGAGQLMDRLGSRIVLTLVTLALSFVVCAMSPTSSFGALAVWITLTRGFGQGALSVVSIAMVGHWFLRKITTAMAVYCVVTSIGFMIAFPLVGAMVQQWGWRAAWLAVGLGLLGILAPISATLVRRGPEACGLLPDGSQSSFAPTELRLKSDRTLTELRLTSDRTPSGATTGYVWTEALLTPAFWVFAAGTALYGLVASGIGLFNESILAQQGFSAQIYYQTLGVTALTALVGNFL